LHRQSLIQGISAVQHTATHLSVLQHTATHCNTLQHTATHCNTLQHTFQSCITLQHTCLFCNTLQKTSFPCNTLQNTFTRNTVAKVCLLTTAKQNFFDCKTKKFLVPQYFYIEILWLSEILWLKSRTQNVFYIAILWALSLTHEKYWG